MTTDPTPLQERIARAFWEYEAGPSGIPWERFAVRCPEVAAERMRNAAPVLPIIAAEVRAAKAEALRGLSAHISEVVDNAKPWQVFTEHVLHEAGTCDYLDRAATEYETGDLA